jgi:ribosomal protein L35AE/L33A
LLVLQTQGARSGSTERLRKKNNGDASAVATNNVDSTHKSDDFIGKLVAFYLDSTVGVELKSSFDQKRD